ncbi:osteocalcin 2-like [Panonychus citri]|uniref:osteocalcin 2-like n=1 Tax=Panonychus citri TaxID=50023 RepID=UPI002306DDD5|nr:osteocalcin 2-like [Panonychus citri]
MNQQWTNGFGQQLTGLNPIVSSIENRGNNNLLTNPFGILVNRPADSSSTSEVEVNVPVSFPNQGLSSSSIVEAIEQQFAPWKESTSSSASSSARGSSVDLQEVAAFELNKMLQKAQSAQWNLPKIQQQATFYSSSSSSSATSSSSESQVKLFSPESLSMKESSSSESSSSEASAEPELK